MLKKVTFEKNSIASRNFTVTYFQTLEEGP